MLSSPRLLLTLAFLEGATVMAVELLSARMLTPYFGAGVHVWGAVIGVTVASLALQLFSCDPETKTKILLLSIINPGV